MHKVMQICILRRFFCAEDAGSTAGLPDCSWYMIPKPEKNVPNEYKMYQMAIKYLESV
jgi:hypothetical protein